MSEIERDHVLRRAVQTLQQLPGTNAEAIRRVVEAAAAQRVMPAADEPADVSAIAPSRRRRWRLAGFAGLVAAAAIVGFFARGQLTRSTPSGSVASSATRGRSADRRGERRIGRPADPAAVRVPKRDGAARVRRGRLQ